MRKSKKKVVLLAETNLRASAAIRETAAQAQISLAQVENFADVIPFTPDIHAASHLRRAFASL
jgi:hypothetical protein